MEILVGHARIDAAVGDAFPYFAVAIGAERPDALRLMRRKNRVGHAGVDERTHDFVVAGGLRQPQSLGLAREAMFEISDTPFYFCAEITFIAERQDRVIVR